MKEFEKPIVTELEELHKENLKLEKVRKKLDILLSNVIHSFFSPFLSPPPPPPHIFTPIFFWL